jgi:hypothetical protein
MAGEAAQHVGLLQPMLVELGRELHEVARDRGAGDHRVGDVRQEAVQRVPELVEERPRIVEGEERRAAIRALGEVHDVDDDRPDIVVEPALAAEGAHPRPRPLGGPGAVIAEEQPDMPPVAVGHLEGANVRMVERDVVTLAEGEPKEARGRVERRRDHPLQRESTP